MKWCGSNRNNDLKVNYKLFKKPNGWKKYKNVALECT